MTPEDAGPFVWKPPNFSFNMCSRRKLKSVDVRYTKLSTAVLKTENMLKNTDSGRKLRGRRNRAWRVIAVLDKYRHITYNLKLDLEISI
jgi:hypothetical protein